MAKVVAVLDTMWDWEAATSSAGYTQAPRHFRINKRNHTGRRLYWFLGHYDLLCTDSCPELVSSPKGRGKPNKQWLRQNLAELWPFELLLVCGTVARKTYEQRSAPHPCRIIEMPHPAARHWTTEALEKARRHIQEGTQSLTLSFVRIEGAQSKSYRLVAEKLVPF